MKQGFTLVELLVTVAILAVLASLLFPTFYSARNKSKQAVCLSNLGQIGKGIAMYAIDYDDHIAYAPSPFSKQLASDGRSPFSEDALNKLAQSLPDVRQVLKAYGVSFNVWSCPMDRIDSNLAAEGGHAATWYEETGSSYNYDDKHALVGRTLASYPRPSENILASDMSPFHGSYGSSGIINILFADIHVEGTTNRQRVVALLADP